MTKGKYVALCALISAPLCDAFAIAPPSKGALVRDSASALSMSNGKDDTPMRVFGGAASFLAGLGVAAQIAFADPNAVVSSPSFESSNTIIQEYQTQSATSSNLLLSAGAPSFGGGGSFDTLDFSLPSYNDALQGNTETSEKKAPAFSASFPEIKLPESTESQQDDSADKAAAEAEKKAAAEAEKKAAAEAKAAQKAAAEAEKKAAAEAKAAEKAAAEAKKQAEEEAAAQKKAEAAARREQQKKLQEEMAAKARAAKEAEQAEKAAAAEATKESPPPTPTPAPAPAPAPAPDFEMPAIKAPELPSFSAPKFDVPKFDAPKFDAPKFDAPKFDVPKIDTPKFDIPAPAQKPTPIVSTPSYDLDFKAPSAPAQSQTDEDIEPQEVRDERARDAKLKFKDLDREAKDIEAQAKAARDKANEAKKDAKLAKDEACKTRPGGKILCLRGFGVGY